jgi:hypothetical protein
MRSVFWWTNVKARGYVVQRRRRLFAHTHATDISVLDRALCRRKEVSLEVGVELKC